MGWITDRRNRTGLGLAAGHKKGRRSKAPLCKIVEIIRSSSDMFSQNKVLLECGHTAYSNGIYRARCIKCLDEVIVNCVNI